jgi:tetratricopeptide (TPR) repeat protein
VRALLLLGLIGCAAPKPVAKAAPVKKAVPAAAVVTLPPGCVEKDGHRAQENHAATLAYAVALRGLRSPDDRARGEALRSLDKLVETAPWFAPAYRALATAHVLRGAWVPAYVSFTRYLGYDIYPLDREKVTSERKLLEQKQGALAAYAQGEAAAQKRDWLSAVKYFEQAVALKSSFTLAHRDLGLGYLALGMKTQARESLETYLKLDAAAPDKADIEKRLSVL